MTVVEKAEERWGGCVCVCGGVLELEEWNMGRETERERVRKDNFFTG